MGTHPIFESDFDCLTDMSMEEPVVNDVGMNESKDELKEEIPEELEIVEIDDLTISNDAIEKKAKKITVQVENHADSLVNNMMKLKEDKDTCDVILRVKKGNYYWA